MVAVIKGVVLLRQDKKLVSSQKGKEESGGQRQNSGQAPGEARHVAGVVRFPNPRNFQLENLTTGKISLVSAFTK